MSRCGCGHCHDVDVATVAMDGEGLPCLRLDAHPLDRMHLPFSMKQGRPSALEDWVRLILAEPTQIRHVIRVVDMHATRNHRRTTITSPRSGALEVPDFEPLKRLVGVRRRARAGRDALNLLSESDELHFLVGASN